MRHRDDRLISKLMKAWEQNTPKDCSQLLLDALGLRHQRLQNKRQQLAWAYDRNWQGALRQVKGEVLHLARSVHEALSSLKAALEVVPVRKPTWRHFQEELGQLRQEFDQVTIDWKHQFLAVQTESIVLEGIYLGPFSLRLYWDRPWSEIGNGWFEIVALDPNPPGDNADVSHPHVKEDVLCPGDAQLPLQKAMHEGRLADAFCLLRSVLQTYNPGSAYVRLDNWEGLNCGECGQSVSQDEHWFCESCLSDVCSECSYSCHSCGRARCSSCIRYCELCTEPCCSGCLRESELSGTACCADCQASCPVCQQMVTANEVNEQTGLCPACQQKAPPSAATPEDHHAIPLCPGP